MSVYKVFSGLKDLLKRDEIVVDGSIFRLHNVFTAVMLFAGSLVITATQYVGTPIECITGSLPTKPINTYCWVMATYAMNDSFDKKIGVEAAHPGVSSNVSGHRKYYAYYQWVCFALFFQGMACYAPKWLWDMWEGGLMKTLVMGLNRHLLSEAERNKKKSTVLSYIMKHIKTHRSYAVRYWFCEFLCLCNILTQMYLMNEFFDGEFWDYGLRILKLSDMSQSSRVDPMTFLFPRVTKCVFHKYGPSGDIQNHDALCVLPLNIVNEKMYVLVWFWFMALAVLLSLLMCYRTCLVFLPNLRPKLLKIRKTIAQEEEVAYVTSNLDIGDWWVLFVLSKNMDPRVFSELIVDLAQRFHRKNMLAGNAEKSVSVFIN